MAARMRLENPGYPSLARSDIGRVVSSSPQTLIGPHTKATGSAPMYVYVLNDSTKLEDDFKDNILSALEVPYQGQPFWIYLAKHLFKENKFGIFVSTPFNNGGYLDQDAYLQLLSSKPFYYTVKQLVKAMIDTNVDKLVEAGKSLEAARVRLEPSVPSLVPSDIERAESSPLMLR